MTTDGDYGSIAPVCGKRRGHPPFSKRRSSLFVHNTFLEEFRSARGGWLIVLLGFLTALGLGCLIGVVPQIATQRYAENNFGYDDQGRMCNSFSVNDATRPQACVLGADYAQSAASYSTMAKNIFALVFTSVAGSYADRHGRRGVQIFCFCLLSLPSIVLVLIQKFHSIHPSWYFAFESLAGMVNFFSIAITQLSDLVTPRHRAASYGLYFGAFMGGIAVAPFCATLVSHFHIAIFSACVRLAAIAIAILFLPETLPTHTISGATEASTRREESFQSADTIFMKTIGVILRPIREMEILRRNLSIILVAVGAFMSKMVFSGDITLFFYYAERDLGVRDKDVASMMFVGGMLGVLVQGGSLKYLISLLGEHKLLLVSFLSGTIHNLLYGLAPNKWFLYIGLSLSSLTNTNFPMLSAFASRNVSSKEQGRIQGALFALTSLAEAIGPLCFNFIYKNWHAFGPGTMFVFGSMLFFLGMIAVSLIPQKPDNGDPPEDEDQEAMLT